MRKNQGKPRLHKALMMPEAMRAMVDVIEFGEKKYTPARERGWLNYSIADTVDSLLRHTCAMVNGEEFDPESGLHHAVHAQFNASVIVELLSASGSLYADSPEQTQPGDS